MLGFRIAMLYGKVFRGIKGKMNKIICPNCNKNVEKSEKCELCDSGLILNERYYLKILGFNFGVKYKIFIPQGYTSK